MKWESLADETETWTGRGQCPRPRESGRVICACCGESVNCAGASLTTIAYAQNGASNMCTPLLTKS